MSQEVLKKLIIEKVYRNGSVMIEEDEIIAEERIDFYLNGMKLLSVMGIAQDQDAHIVGFLMSEGVITHVEDIHSLRISDNGLSVYIDASVNEENIQNLFKEKTLTTGCCVGVTGNVEDKIVKEFNRSTISYNVDMLFDEVDRFYGSSALFRQSGCVHKARLVLQEGEAIEAEDVGRHNAIDKVIGKARLSHADTQDAFLIVSGRLSMEMVVKCVMHGITMVISKAAPTRLGIKTAQLHGITLIGFAREGKMNLYTHSSRVDTAHTVIQTDSTPCVIEEVCVAAS
ncbi:MAG: formate dehydrogenase accessory sulfurtransferase FdhD [Sulfuricurvum sp.]|uniref:formate dehydrogenase accessory sulfurtransferase FdhD n=1 Tax=Sulfuricurvum sp. TaxID=2025608 RepID=UPI0025CFE036|nr:formate dehydrogenase accessory sulfurtransferase FdhD [Sulfuricurvum sp.]MBV5320655.1 formate dehydrogenase accessory sulfurtransferase FdhD [Sulfuricurvum sp.]